MTDPRASSALAHLPLDEAPPTRWAFAIVAPDPSGRVQLPSAALDALATGPGRARMAGGVLVLGRGDGAGRPIGIDRRGRCYLPVWVRQPAVLVATDAATGVVLVADAAVLDPIGDRLARAAGA